MTITISDWRSGFEKVRFNHLLREHAGYGLGEAKRTVDCVLAHEAVTIELGDERSAEEFCRLATEIGAVCHLHTPA